MTVLRLLLAGSVLGLAGCASVLPTSTDTTTSQAGQGIPYGMDLRLGRAAHSPLAMGQHPEHGAASLEPAADLWDRIRQGFAITDLDSVRVTQQEQWYSSRPDYILRMTERSKRYLFHIVEELEKRNMPTELALLPYIESAFNPQAVSSAKAAGMWQFMPATGTYFDLKQNMLRDDRRDVLASTRAALDYLQKLHRMFGDWHLALAAYNWGEGSVSRAIKRNQSQGLGTSYAELQMPAETQMYVPKLQAVKNIIANPAAFATELPTIENHPFFQVVNIQQDMDAELVANLADVSVSDFRALNPSLKKPVIFAAATPQVLLPWDNAQVFQRNLRELGQGKLASWTVWTTPKTMSVAEAAKQVGMSEAALRDANNIPPRMLIKAGSALMVPRTTTRPHNVAAHIADTASLSLMPEPPPAPTIRRVQVQRGQTLLGLAKTHGVSVNQLASWNKISPKAQLKIGQVLQIHQQRASASARSRSPAATTRVSSAASSPPATKRRTAASTGKPSAKAARTAAKAAPKKR